MLNQSLNFWKLHCERALIKVSFFRTSRAIGMRYRKMLLIYCKNA